MPREQGAADRGRHRTPWRWARSNRPARWTRISSLVKGSHWASGCNSVAPMSAVRVQGEICPADAGAAVRRDGGCGRTPRFRAHAVDARAAYPPRKGDQQHLHQFSGSVLRWPSPSICHAAGRGRPDARSGAHQPCQGQRHWPTAWRALPGVEVVNDARLLQRVHRQAAQAKAAPIVVRTLAERKGIIAGVPASRGCYPRDKGSLENLG